LVVVTTATLLGVAIPVMGAEVVPPLLLAPVADVEAGVPEPEHADSIPARAAT